MFLCPLDAQKSKQPKPRFPRLSYPKYVHRTKMCAPLPLGTRGAFFCIPTPSCPSCSQLVGKQGARGHRSGSFCRVLMHPFSKPHFETFSYPIPFSSVIFPFPTPFSKRSQAREMRMLAIKASKWKKGICLLFLFLYFILQLKRSRNKS